VDEMEGESHREGEQVCVDCSKIAPRNAISGKSLLDQGMYACFTGYGESNVRCLAIETCLIANALLFYENMKIVLSQNSKELIMSKYGDGSYDDQQLRNSCDPYNRTCLR
jgi:hypothetical protein